MTIEVNMNPDDLKRLVEKAGLAGMTVGQLLTSFAEDLMSGEHSNGSDERDLAHMWFDRTGFERYAYEGNLLQRLLYDGGARTVDNYLTAYDERAYYQEHPEELAEDYDSEDDWWWTEDLEICPEPDPDDLQAVRDWFSTYKEIK